MSSKSLKIPYIPSPCEGVCKIDIIDGLCKGCLRTIDEIELWSSMSNEDRLLVVGKLRERRISKGRIGRPERRRMRRRIKKGT